MAGGALSICALPHTILVRDLDGKILSWDPSATKLYGWNEAEALTMNIRDLIPQGAHEAALAVEQQLSRAEVLQPYHMERIAKDGRVLRVSLTATALVSESGAVYAIATTERAAD